MSRLNDQHFVEDAPRYSFGDPDTFDPFYDLDDGANARSAAGTALSPYGSSRLLHGVSMASPRRSTFARSK